MQINIELDDKQIEMLRALSKHRKDDFKDDFLDETLLKNVFKIGLVDVARFYAKDGKDTELSDRINKYMTDDMLDSPITVEDLLDLWE